MDAIIEQDCLEYINKIDFSPLRNKTVCITGANGLIGTYLIYMLHLANRNKNAGIRIAAVSKSSSCDKLKDIFSNAYAFYSGDLSKTETYDFPFKADYIIHGATYAQPGKFLKNYLETIHLNTTATEGLLNKAKKDDAKFLYLSSSEIYGDPDRWNIPTPETYPGLCSSVNARSVYSESKRLGETLCFAYRNFESIDAKVARISMSYGPGVCMNDERVLSHFIRQALDKGKIRMLDDGSKIRTFCYVADCVLMLLNILLYGRDFVYNVGGTDRITIRKLAEEICSLTGSSLEAETTARSHSLSMTHDSAFCTSDCDTVARHQLPDKNIKFSPQHVELDIGKIRAEFDLPPFKPLKDGLSRTIQWHIANRTIWRQEFQEVNFELSLSG